MSTVAQSMQWQPFLLSFCRLGWMYFCFLLLTRRQRGLVQRWLNLEQPMLPQLRRFCKNQDHPRFSPISWYDDVPVFHPVFVLEDLPYALKLKLEAVAFACLDQGYSCVCQGPCSAQGGPICHKGFVAGLGCSEVSGGAHVSAATAQFLRPFLVFSSAAEHAFGPCHCRLKASSLHSVDTVPCK